MHDTSKSFLGTATVGERGQVAIPADARRAFGIEPGAKILFFMAPNNMGLLMVKAEQLSHLVEHLTSKAQSLTNKAQSMEQILNRVEED